MASEADARLANVTVITRPRRIFSCCCRPSADASPAHPRRSVVVYLVRHGEATHNIKEKKAKAAARDEAIALGFGRDSPECLARMEVARTAVLDDHALHDAPLSDEGKAMATRAKASIARLASSGLPQPGLILVSPLQRALQTAAVLFPGHEAIHVREELRERQTGYACDEHSSSELISRRSATRLTRCTKL